MVDGRTLKQPSRGIFMGHQITVFGVWIRNVFDLEGCQSISWVCCMNGDSEILLYVLQLQFLAHLVCDNQLIYIMHLSPNEWKGKTTTTRVVATTHKPSPLRPTTPPPPTHPAPVPMKPSERVFFYVAGHCDLDLRCSDLKMNRVHLLDMTKIPRPNRSLVMDRKPFFHWKSLWPWPLT